MNREDLTVAIIDDEEQLRTMLSFFLEDYEYQIIMAESGVAALKSNDCIGADIAIVDMRMEEMDGNQTIEALHEKNPAMKFILHTGSNDYVIPDTLKSFGVTELSVLHKPVFDMYNFCILIDKLCQIDE